MMKKNIFIFFFLALVSTSVFTQTKEDRNGNLIGYLEKSDFLEGKYKVWFEKNYNDYQPKQKVVTKIKKQLKGISVKTFLGSWCHDSKRELPRFFKVMESAEFDLKNNFKIIGITRGKKTPDNLQEGYNIKHTPTFIFYKDGKEIGRYVEHSRETLEKDILKILKGKRYKHTYQK
jgi:thiol-disulfide isomerase/thioredoxin